MLLATGARHCYDFQFYVEKADIPVRLIPSMFASYCQVLHTCQEEYWNVALNIQL